MAIQLSLETKVPEALKPQLKQQWDNIKGSIQQPRIIGVMNQIETEVTRLFRGIVLFGDRPDPELDAKILANHVDLLFKKFAMHYHFQFPDTEYLNISTDPAAYVHIDSDYCQASANANDCFEKTLTNDEFPGQIVMNGQNLGIWQDCADRL